MHSPAARAGLGDRELTFPLGSSLSSRSSGTFGSPSPSHPLAREEGLAWPPASSPPQGPTARKRGTSQIPIFSMKILSSANNIRGKKGSLGLVPRNHSGASEMEEAVPAT